MDSIAHSDMSTKSTKAYAEIEGLEVHLYREMHDNCTHLLLSGTSYSQIDVVVPDWMIPGLTRLIKTLEA